MSTNIDNNKVIGGEKITPAGNNTTDKIFLLSINEAEKYFLNYKYELATKATNFAKRPIYRKNGISRRLNDKAFLSNGCSSYWLRSPGLSEDEAAFVSETGHVWKLGHDVFGNEMLGIRPAMWISADVIAAQTKETTTEEIKIVDIETIAESTTPTEIVSEEVTKESIVSIESISVNENNNDSNYSNDNSYNNYDDNVNNDRNNEIVEDSVNDNSGASDTTNQNYQNTISLGLNGLDVTFKISELHSGFVQDVSGRWYYFDSFDTNEMSGSFATGWREVNGKTYYFNNNGIMQSNKTIDGIKLGADGAAIITVQETTKAQVKNGWVGDYYYDNDVLVKNRWIGDYYVGSEGKYVKNQWVSEYYIGADGKYVKNKWIGDYYVGTDGKMLKNTVTPDGYQVGSDGKYIQNNNINAKNNSSSLNNNTDNNSQSNIQNDKSGENKSYVNNDVTKLPRKHREYDSSKIYYYAKQEGSKKFITSIKRKDIKDGLFGTGIFAKNTYHDIEIKISDEMNKTFNDYLQFGREIEEDTDTNWVLLAGDSIKTLDVIDDCIIFSSGSSIDTGMSSFYNYNNGTIQLYCISEDKRNTILNKLQTSKIIMLASPKIIKSNKKEYENYTLLGGFTKYRPYETKDLNILEGYVNCENKIIEYSKNNIGKYIYVLDGMFGNEIYVELITKPLTSYEKIDIHTGALPPNVYGMYAKKVDYYAKTGDDFWDSFSIYGGDIVHQYELRLNEEIIDYKYFCENYKNYTWVYE